MKRSMLISLLALGMAAAACGDSEPQATADGGVRADAGSVEPACFTVATTHHEIINACTDAVQLEKTPVLPLLNADGTLPPLP